MFHRFLALCSICLALSAGPTFAEGQISVSGEGSAFAVPDMAIVTLGATANAQSPKEAMDETSRITAAILERLAGFSIAPRDVQTTDLSLNPVWSDRTEPQGRPQISGYEASNRITVRIRKLDQIGAVLDAIVMDGANRLDGLSFTVSNPEPLLNEARRAAVLDAQNKAALFAEAAGVRLGALVSLNDTGVSSPQPEMMRMAAISDAGVPIAQGETELRAVVAMVYEIATP